MAELNAPTTPVIVPGLDQPSAGAASAPASVMESVAPPNLTQGNLPAYGEPGAAQQPSTVVPAGAPVAQPAAPPKHAHLLAMVQGLADGLSAAGAAASTGGREGGAKEVQELQQSRAAAQQRQVAATQAQTDAKLRNALTTAQTNEINLKNIHTNVTMQDDVALSHMNVAAEKTKLAGEEFNLFTGTGMSPDAIDAMVSGKTTSADAKTSNVLQTNADRQYRIAAQLLPAGNPSLVAMRNALDAPNQTPAALVMANQGLQKELAGQEGITDAKIKQAAAAAAEPFGDKADMVNDAILRRMQVNHPEIKALPKGYEMTADSTPADLTRVDKLLLPTETAEATKANRDIVNSMREQMLDLAKGAKIPGDETKSGAEYMATLPAGLQGTIKQIGEGRGAPPPAGSRSPAAQTILGALNRAYPDYDASKYPSYLKARTAFTSGPEGKGVNALNTVETHLSRMYDHATAPGTSGGITGKVTGFFGDKDVRALDIDRTAVSTELSKAYAAGQISEGEVRDWEAKLDFTKPGMTTGKLITNLKEIDELLEGKQKAYEQQWSTASPSASIVSPVPIISPDAASARAKIRGEAAAGGAHVIEIGGVHYTYNGSGDTADLKNYTKK